jgi:hypothetical protein
LRRSKRKGCDRRLLWRPDGGFTASFAIRLGRGLVLLALSEETR